MMKSGKSSTKSSSCDMARSAELDHSVTINDTTLLTDRSAANTDQSLHAVSKPSVAVAAGNDIMSHKCAPARTVTDNAEVMEMTSASNSRLFHLVNADSPRAQVSLFNQ